MLDDNGIELSVLVVFKLAQNYFGREAAAVTALAVHSVKGVANADYSCDKRNILAAFTCGIAFAVIAFMVVHCAELNIIYRGKIPEDITAVGGMLFHLVVLFIGQLSRFCQNGIGDVQLSSIVHKPDVVYLLAFILVKAHMLCDKL